MREQVIKQLIKYIESADDWDLFEIAEWTFGYDDPMIERFREKLKGQEGVSAKPGN